MSQQPDNKLGAYYVSVVDGQRVGEDPREASYAERQAAFLKWRDENQSLLDAIAKESGSTSRE